MNKFLEVSRIVFWLFLGQIVLVIYAAICMVVFEKFRRIFKLINFYAGLISLLIAMGCFAIGGRMVVAGWLNLIPVALNGYAVWFKLSKDVK